MNGMREPERIETVVIGGGQAGLSVGYYLAQRGLPFVILDANKRIGDSWRNRWDSLRLFTPARYDGLAGMPYPASGHSFPTKDEMADYLESYAARFNLPVRSGVRVDRLSKQNGGFLVEAGSQRFEAEQVVVAMSNYQNPKVPSFAGELDSKIVQLHSSEYRNLAQLRDGGVLIVGAGNSGSEIAMEVIRSHPTWMSGRDTGHVPFRIESVKAKFIMPVLFRFIFHRVLTINTPMGRKVRHKVHSGGGPLIRVKPKDIVSAGINRVPRVAGVQDGLPVLEDGQALDISNVIWCTGYNPNFSWIDLPIFNEGRPIQERGVVANEPGLYFVGQEFIYSFSSTMVHGVGRDAEYVVKAVASRSPNKQLVK